MASILSWPLKSYPKTIYVIAENRQAAERLGVLHASGELCAPSKGERTAAIARWRAQPDRLRQAYHVYGVNVMMTETGPIPRVVRIALALSVAMIVGGMIK